MTGAQSFQRPSWPRLLPRQLWALTRKNILVRTRSWKLNVLHALQAVFLMFVVWAIDKAISYSSSTYTGLGAVRTAKAVEIGQIPDCTQNIFLQLGAPCYDFIYSPGGNAFVDSIMANVRKANRPAIPPSRVLGLGSMALADEYLWQHPQTVLAAVHLTVPDDDNQTISFTVQANTSLEFFKGKFRNPMTYAQLPLQSAVQRELVRHAADRSSLPWRMALQDFPHPSLTSSSTVGQVAPVFILASLMFNFVMLLTNVVVERETGVRQAMNTMGMLDSAFWLSWALPEIVFGLIHSVLLCVAAVAFRFDLATRNNFALLFLLVFLADMALTSLCFLVSVFTRRASLAVPLSFAVYIIAWVFQLVVAFGFPFSPDTSKVWVVLFSFFPWTLLSKGISDLAAATTGTNRGITWSQRSSYCVANTPSPEQQAVLAYWKKDCVMPLDQIYLALLLQAAVYIVLAVYMDNVVPNDDGMRRVPWYWMQPSYWWPDKVQSTAYAAEALRAAPQLMQGGGQADWDSDVLQEAAAVQKLCSEYVQHSHNSVPSDNVEAAGHASGDSAIPEMVSNESTGSVAPGGAERACVNQRHQHHHVPPGVHMFGLRKVFPQPLSLPGLWRTCTALWPRKPAPRRSPQEASVKGSDAADTAVPPAAGGSSYGVPLPRENSLTRLSGGSPGARGGSRQSDTGAAAAHEQTDAPAAGAATPSGLVAVDCNWLSILPGQCFCLLGPNGAGKTTTLKCLTGAIMPSGGDALVGGHSVRSAGGLDRIRAMMGVCPQFDVLWGELTAREHLRLFADIRGLPQEMCAEEAVRALEQVKLTDAADRQSRTYSGGMRRRLSVAVALLGDPHVVILDEPTTGMDPISRRHVWDLISAAKAGRVVLLTTHSMEEADVLGDRIGIFARGRLQCLGNGLHLKAKFGSGYRISVSVHKSLDGGGSLDSDQGPAGRVRAVVRRELGVEAEAELSRTWLHFLAPRGCKERLARLFAALNDPDLGVADVQVSLTPLEEVFLDVARRAEVGATKHGADDRTA